MRDVEVESGKPVWDLVAEFLERREKGERIDAETFIHSHPELADRLREALGGFQWMEAKARPAHASMDEVLPRTFGNYDLLRVIGRGGMGCVYEAMHRPLRRHVAVKVLPPHLTDVREFRLRFLREARVVASLHHTHIAPVFEVGQIGNTLYLSMPFIDGPNLRELTFPAPEDTLVLTKAIRSRLPQPMTPAYLRWVGDIGVQAADALAHAHSHGIIHRDVKPSNLLLDDHGQIWIVDFGLAKAPTHPTVTQPGELVGTLRYASPEQVRGELFDERTDVYSLGVTLYELLVRRAAFPPGAGHPVLATEPVRPRRVNSRIPRDLETIVLRAMARRPQDRYQSATALADDLRRFLRDEPIRARPIGWFGRVLRWSRRNPLVTGVASAAAFLMVALLVIDYRRVAEHREARSIEEKFSKERYAAFLRVNAARMIDSGQPERSRLALEMIREAADIEFRDELWELALSAIGQLDATPGAELKETDRSVHLVAVSPGGKEFIGVEPDGTFIFWDTSNGEAWPRRGFGEPLLSIAWAADENRLVGVSPKHVWVGSFDRNAHTVEDARAILYGSATATFSPNGRQIAVWGESIGVWDTVEGQWLWQRPSPHVSYQAIAWSPDGKTLAAIPRGEATIEFWSMPDGDRLLPIGVLFDEVERLQGPPIAAICFSPDSRRVVCGCADGLIRVYDRENATLERTLRGHDGPVKWLSYFSPWGRTVKTSSWSPFEFLISSDDYDVRLWDCVRGQFLGLLVRTVEDLRSLSVDDAGTVLALVDSSGAPRTWRLPDTRLHQVIAPEKHRVSSVAAAAQSNLVAWATERGHISVTDIERRLQRIDFESNLGDAKLAFNPVGTTLAIGGEGNPPIQLYSLRSGETRTLGEGVSRVLALAFVGAGDRLAAAHADNTLIVWSLDTSQPFASMESIPISSLAASSDGKWLVAGGTGGALHIWNAASMAYKHVATAHDSQILAVAFSPDGRSVASASKDGRICRWKVPSLKRELSFEGPGGSVRDLAFCLDGSTLVTCGGDGRVFLWASDRPTRVGALASRNTGRFDVLTVTYDGQRLIAAGGPRQMTASGPGALEVWDLAALHRAVLAAELPDWRYRTD